MPVGFGHHTTMNIRIFLWSLTAALAGFLFGFDTVVISGAEKTIQSLWGLSPGVHGFAMASALYGTVAGSLLGSWPADRFGRKSDAVVDRTTLHHRRGGIRARPECRSIRCRAFHRRIGNWHLDSRRADVYQIAPAKQRGRLAGMFQFNIVFGILVAFVSNALLAGIGESAWRWMLGVAAFPSLLYALSCYALPESPRWLLSRKGNRETGMQVLHQIQPEASAPEISAQADEIMAASTEQVSSGHFLDSSAQKANHAGHLDRVL